MKRIVLFLATNIAIVLVLGISMRLLGFEGILDQQGVDLGSGVYVATLDDGTSTSSQNLIYLR